MKHDFVARSQSEFFASAKANLADGEYLICLDFSENYAFKIQDAVQSYHWNNNQATLHPYVIYRATKKLHQQVFFLNRYDRVIQLQQCFRHI